MSTQKNRTAGVLMWSLLAWGAAGICAMTASAEDRANLAPVARASTSYVSGHEKLAAINDGFEPAHSNDRHGDVYGNWPQTGEQWVQLEWPVEITTDGSSVYWFEDGQGIRSPGSARLLYLDGSGAWSELVDGLGVEKDSWNTVDHKAVTTRAVRLVMTGRERFSTGVLEWRVFDDGGSPAFPPSVDAGRDRTVMLDGMAILRARPTGVQKPDARIAYRWSAVGGPGRVVFADAADLHTLASFSTPGRYTLSLRAEAGGLSASDTVEIEVVEPLEGTSLEPVQTGVYEVDSAFWEPRLRNLVLNWIPHCIAKCEEADLKEGGLNNMIDAARKLRGEDHAFHRGYTFSNAWVLNTLEAMCWAQMLDAGDDTELAQGQAFLREKIEEWIPIVLAAQEPDGYFQTRYTLGYDREAGQVIPRWDPAYRTEHEGYIAGYFIEAAIAHVRWTEGEDRRLYDAAKKLADLWNAEIGPDSDQRAWYDGHQGIKIALYRFERLVDEMEGPGAGAKYGELADYLLSQRGSSPAEVGDKAQNYGLGAEYDQSHAPVIEQYEAVGHAVRAVYQYVAVAEAAKRSGDPSIEGAVFSINDNMVNRKYYVTGGVGSGETAEGFGEDYSLPVNAYCESCSGVGEMLFQHRMNLLTGRAEHADLYEETLYNAVLSDIDIEGQNFTYTNPLDTDAQRYKWHVCPCCVGNIPRAMLQLPTWTYTAGDAELFVNLYIGGRMDLDVGGTPVTVVQETDYPTSGRVSISLEPSEPTRFTLGLRVPDRSVSTIYRSEPEAGGLLGLRVNGASVIAPRSGGYATLTRVWEPGDTVELDMPMPIQRVRAIDEVESVRGRVALRRGPLVFNFEAVDQDLDSVLTPYEKLEAVYDESLLGGVLTIRGEFADGGELLAIPNFARNNRGGRSMVWIREGVTARRVRERD